MSLSIKFSIMARFKQNQNIDDLIQGIEVIAENQCSLSEQDRIILNEALSRLQFLKRKKGKTNEQVLNEVVKVVELLTKFFVE
jgi:hypothetical protein